MIERIKFKLLQFAGIRVYNTSLFQDLLKTTERPRTTGTIRSTPKKTQKEIRLLQRRKKYLQKQEEQEAEDRLLIERYKEKAKSREDAKFKKLFETLDKGKDLVKSMDQYVEMTDSK